MIIDIIDLTDEQYQNLTSVQLAMIYSAQTQKNEVVMEGNKQKTENLSALLAQNMARSSLRQDSERQIDEETQVKIDAIKEDLLYRLAYEKEKNDNGDNYRYPDNPNWDISLEQRFLVVREYYMHLTQNHKYRLELFGKDYFAMDYLGEFYQTLYDLFAYYASY